MGTGKRPCLVAGCCVLVTLLGVSMTTARSLSKSETELLEKSTNLGGLSVSSWTINHRTRSGDGVRIAAKAAEAHISGSKGSRSLGDMDVSHVADHNFSSASQVKPRDYSQCFKVCCWQGDPDCPYPYCNFNEMPCN